MRGTYGLVGCAVQTAFFNMRACSTNSRPEWDKRPEQEEISSTAYVSWDFDLFVSLNLHHQQSWSSGLQIRLVFHLLPGSPACCLQVVDFEGFITV